MRYLLCLIPSAIARTTLMMTLELDAGAGPVRLALRHLEQFREKVEICVSASFNRGEAEVRNYGRGGIEYASSRSCSRQPTNGGGRRKRELPVVEKRPGWSMVPYMTCWPPRESPLCFTGMIMASPIRRLTASTTSSVLPSAGSHFSSVSTTTGFSKPLTIRTVSVWATTVISESPSIRSSAG